MKKSNLLIILLLLMVEYCISCGKEKCSRCTIYNNTNTGANVYEQCGTDSELDAFEDDMEALNNSIGGNNFSCNRY